MFLFSQFLLHKTSKCDSTNIMNYTIPIGISFYTIIYGYLMYSSPTELSIMNNFLIYIFIIDLVLSLLYYYHIGGGKSDKETDSEYSDSTYDTNTDSTIRDILDDFSDEMEKDLDVVDESQEQEQEQEQTQEQLQEQPQEQPQEQLQEQPQEQTQEQPMKRVITICRKGSKKTKKEKDSEEN